MTVDASAPAPLVVVLGGPNGAGKTAVARWLLPRFLDLGTFVNADAIAVGLSAFTPESASIRAGRLMLDRLHELAGRREDFAFETTLASRLFARFLRLLKRDGYRVHIVSVALDSPELAIERVRYRVTSGGQMIPNEEVGRRFHRGVANFFNLYAPIAEMWKVYDISNGPARLLAEMVDGEVAVRGDLQEWERFRTLRGQS